MNTKEKTYANPLNLSYRFQVQGWAKESLREAADPSVVYYQGEFWMFPSKSGGYWHSPDMKEWSFIKTKLLPTEDYAPDVRVINASLYFTASKGDKPCPIYKSTDPKSDNWEKINDLFPYWDPCMFQDDDGRVYLYWGCSNENPIFGIELDSVSMLPKGEKVALIQQTSDMHGWEQPGDNNSSSVLPHIEGAWMTKHEGTYYLQYAAPGTEYNIYGDGVYTSKFPLGPYQYAPQNPFSFKPGGFINGAGHGSTFEDKFGNLWHISTMRISVKHIFERRIGIWPAGFDKDGVLFCNNFFGDYPTNFPTGKWDPIKDPFKGWMLLTYKKSVLVSSFREGHLPEYAVNEDVRSYWSAKTGNAGEWIQVDMERSASVHAIQINFAEEGCCYYGREGEQLFHQYLLEGSLDGREWSIVCDKRNNDKDVPHDYMEFDEPFEIQFLKMTNKHMPANGAFAISGFRVFGNVDGSNPAQVVGINAQRSTHDARCMNITWEAVLDATGYNVHWGFAPDKLYNSWLVYGQNDLFIRCLNKEQSYWIRIDAFNEHGVTEGDVIKMEEKMKAL